MRLYFKIYMMRIALVLLILSILNSCKEDKPVNAKEVLDRSIAFHDPHGKWQNFSYELDFVAHLPDSTKPETTIQMDHPRQFFRYIRYSDSTDLGMVGDSCFAVGRDSVDCFPIRRTRDYWTYLWGLPMKLKDPGTELDPHFKDTVFEGRPVYRIKVTYPREVYYFSIDKETYQLVGEEFYIDEEKQVGERMIREGEVNVDGIILPRTRAWFNTHDSLYLATDELLNFKKLD